MLTVRDVLALEVLNGARVVAGDRGLDRPIRWVHVVDIPDVADWVKGGELLLTTGVSLYEKPSLQEGLVRSLTEKEVAGLAIAVGRYFETIPQIMASDADALGLPLIALPFEIPFVEITQVIHQLIIDEKYRLLKRSHDIHNALTAVVLDQADYGKLATALAKLIQRSITIEDTAFQVLAAATAGEVDDARRESIRTKRTPPRLLAKLRETGVLQKLQESSQPLRIGAMPGEGLVMERLVTPVVVGGHVHGYIWIIAGDRPLESLDFAAVQQAATVAALLMLKEKAVAEAEERWKADFLTRVLSPGMRPNEELLLQGQRLGYQLGQSYQVALISVQDSRDVDVERLATTAQRVIQSAGQMPLLYRRHGELTLLLPAQHPYVPREELAKIVEGAKLTGAMPFAGLGRPYSEPEKLYQSYREARRAMLVGRVLGAEKGGIWDYGEVAILSWLRQLPDDVIEASVFGEPLAHLLRADQANLDELLLSLEVYLDQGGNGLKAARVLHVHRNTLRYRLARIEKLLGVSLADTGTCFQLHMALKALRLRRGTYSLDEWTPREGEG